MDRLSFSNCSNNAAIFFHFPSELNYCELNPKTCTNGGKCTSITADEGSFKCECPTGVKGKKCDIVPMLPNATTTTTQEPANGDESLALDDVDEDDDELITTTEIAVAHINPTLDDEKDNEA